MPDKEKIDMSDMAERLRIFFFEMFSNHIELDDFINKKQLPCLSLSPPVSMQGGLICIT